MEGWMNGKMDGWMDVDRWMDGCLDRWMMGDEGETVALTHWFVFGEMANTARGLGTVTEREWSG